MVKYLLTLFIGSFAVGHVAHAADSYPSKPLRFVVASAAGGASDILARIIGEQLQQSLGQPVLVEPIPGANGNLAAETVARAPADGYTLMMGTIGVMAINPIIYENVRFNPLTDYDPVVRLVSFSNVLVVHPSLPIQSVDDLIKYAKEKPGALRYGSPGIGGSPHMASLVFGQMAGIDIQHVPYKGAAMALNDLMGGHIEMAFSDPLLTLQHVRNGRVRALAVSGEQRLESEPNIPTVAEAGVPGYEVSGWLGVVVPKNTPPDRVAKLNVAINEALQKTEIRKQLIDRGSRIHGGTSEEFAEFIKTENARWRKVLANEKLN